MYGKFHQKMVAGTESQRTPEQVSCDRAIRYFLDFNTNLVTIKFAGFLDSDLWFSIPSLKLTAKAPENKPKRPKRNVVFQPSIFRCYANMLVSGSVIPIWYTVGLGIYL